VGAGIQETEEFHAKKPQTKANTQKVQESNHPVFLCDPFAVFFAPFA
jgi:hypothetical protein